MLFRSEIFGFESNESLAPTVKATLEAYFGEADTVFYHIAGLIRVGYTINHKTKRYKTPFDVQEFLDADLNYVFDKSSVPRLDFKFQTMPTLEPKYQHLIQKQMARKRAINNLFSPTKIVTCVQDMYKIGEEKGSRHNRMMRMVSAWRRAGVPKPAIVSAMMDYAPSMQKYEVEKHVTDTFENGYMWGCDDPIMKQFCSARCVYHTNKDYAPNISTASSMEKEYVKFARTDFSTSSFNFQDIFPQIQEPFMMYPGYFFTLIGDTGLNKTALMQNIAVRLPKFPILYLSTEFGNILLFRRFAQIANGLSKQQVDEHYQVHDNTLSNKFSHIHFLKVTPNLDNIATMIKRTQPKMVIIDTIEDIPVKNERQGTGKDEVLAMRMKQIAEETETIIGAVHHIRKPQDDNTPVKITLHQGKGSGSYSQKPDVVIGIEGDRRQTLRTIKILKGRDDAPFEVIQQVDMNTFQFKNLQRVW